MVILSGGKCFVLVEIRSKWGRRQVVAAGFYSWKQAQCGSDLSRREKIFIFPLIK